MPSTYTDRARRDHEHQPDLYTRLQIQTQTGDQGDRPLGGPMADSDAVFSSAAITVEPPALRLRQPVQVGVEVLNGGTMTATGAMLEVYACIDLLHAREAWRLLTTRALPPIAPAGSLDDPGRHVETFSWTPSHWDIGGCLTARVYDTTAMLHHMDQVIATDARDSRLIAHRSVRRIPAPGDAPAGRSLLAVPFQVTNFGDAPLTVTLRLDGEPIAAAPLPAPPALPALPPHPFRPAPDRRRARFGLAARDHVVRWGHAHRIVREPPRPLQLRPTLTLEIAPGHTQRADLWVSASARQPGETTTWLVTASAPGHREVTHVVAVEG